MSCCFYAKCEYQFHTAQEERGHRGALIKLQCYGFVLHKSLNSGQNLNDDRIISCFAAAVSVLYWVRSHGAAADPKVMDKRLSETLSCHLGPIDGTVNISQYTEGCKVFTIEQCCPWTQAFHYYRRRLPSGRVEPHDSPAGACYSKCQISFWSISVWLMTQRLCQMMTFLTLFQPVSQRLRLSSPCYPPMSACKTLTALSRLFVSQRGFFAILEVYKVPKGRAH